MSSHGGCDCDQCASGATRAKDRANSSNQQLDDARAEIRKLNKLLAKQEAINDALDKTISNSESKIKTLEDLLEFCVKQSKEKI